MAQSSGAASPSTVQFAALVHVDEGAHVDDDSGQHDWHDEAANRSKEDEEALQRSLDELRGRNAPSPTDPSLPLADRIRQWLMVQPSVGNRQLWRQKNSTDPRLADRGDADPRSWSRSAGTSSRANRSDGVDSRLSRGESDTDEDAEERHQERQRRHAARLQGVRVKRNEECHRAKDRAEAALQSTAEKSRIAENRREFMRVTEQLARTEMWRCVLVSYFFARRVLVARQLHMARFTLMTRVIPMLRLRLRVKWRKLKNAQLAESSTFPRATVDDLKSDNLLSKFPHDQLVNSMRSLMPVYHSAGEYLLYQGAEGQELYVLVQGTVQIIVEEVSTEVEELTGKEKKIKTRKVVATIAKRWVLGTIGMITGESRMASIKCLTDCVFWSLTRSSFQAAAAASGDNAAENARIAKEAMNEVTILHTKNMSGIYAGFKPDSLLKYSTFAGTSLPARQMILPASPHYQVFHHGDYFIRGGVAQTQAFIVLRGAITFTWPGGVPPTSNALQHTRLQTLETSVRDGTFNLNIDHGHGALGGVPGFNRPDTMGRQRNLTEIIPTLVDIPDLKFAPRNAALDKMMGRPNRPFITLAAPLILGMRHITFPDLPEVDVMAATNCDVIIIKHDVTPNMALQEAASVMAIRRRLNIQFAECQQPPTPAELLLLALRQLHDEALRANATAHVARKSTWMPSTTAMVMEENDTLSFRPGSRDVYFFITGKAEDAAYRGQEAPYLWPTLPDAFFGTNISSAVIGRKSLVFKMTRRDFIGLFRHLLNETIVNAVAVELRDRFVRMMGRDPTFEGEYLPAVTEMLQNSRRKTVTTLATAPTADAPQAAAAPGGAAKSRHPSTAYPGSLGASTSSPRHATTISISETVDEISDSEETDSESTEKLAPTMSFANAPPAVAAPRPPEDPLADVVRHVKSFHKGGLSREFASSMHHIMVSNAIARQLDKSRATSVSSFGSAESDGGEVTRELPEEHVLVGGVRLPRTLTLRRDTLHHELETSQSSGGRGSLTAAAISASQNNTPRHRLSKTVDRRPYDKPFFAQVDPSSFVTTPPPRPQFNPTMPAFAGLILPPTTIAALQPHDRLPLVGKHLPLQEGARTHVSANGSQAMLASQLGLVVSNKPALGMAEMVDIRTPFVKRTLPTCLESIRPPDHNATAALRSDNSGLDRKARLEALLTPAPPPQMTTLSSASTRAIAKTLESHFAAKLANASAALSRSARGTKDQQQQQASASLVPRAPLTSRKR